MSFFLVAHDIASGLNTMTTAGVDTTGADLIVIHIGQRNSTTLGDITDNMGNVFTPLTQQTCVSGTSISNLYYKATPTVGTGHTFTFTGTSLAGSIAIQAWSGSDASPFDVENGGFDGGIHSASTGSVTPSLDNSLIVTGIDPATGYDTTLTLDSGFTVSDEVPEAPGNYDGEGMAYLVQTSLAAVNPTWTWTAGNDFSARNIAVFKAAAAPAPPGPLLWARSVM